MEGKDIKGENKIIFDINISSVQDLYNILLNKKYDFVTLEPEDEKVSVKFRKDWKVVDERFIKYPIYSEIIIKAKTIANLDVWETKETQEWKVQIDVDGQKYDFLAKVVPGNFWEKLFLKLKFIEQKAWDKKVSKKANLWQLLGFFWATLIILLVVWGSFLAFIVLNAKTVDDVRFFLTLWIDLNQINDFIWTTIRIFFSILVCILTIFLVIFLFRFLLTKKIFKKKKAKYWIFALTFFVFTFSTAGAWMFLDKKVRELPEWDIMALWDVQVYDNSKLKSEKFTKAGSFIKDTSNMIWPVEIKFDLSQLAKKESKWWTLKIRKYTWNFGWWIPSTDTSEPELIMNFTKKWNYQMDVEIELVDEVNVVTKKTLKNLPMLDIRYIVDIREKQLNSWWKQITFDATSLKELWKAEWYTEEWWDDPVYEGSIYITKTIFEETMIWLYLKNESKKSKEFDKVFIIDWEQWWRISWDIEMTKSAVDDKEITFRVVKPKTSEWSWFIENYTWKIENREYKKEWENAENAEKSSEIKHKFGTYGKFEVSVELTSSSWEKKTITKIIDVTKDLKIKDWLKFSVDWEKIEDENVRHNSATWEYYINEFWIPSTLNIDARYVKPDNIIYALDEISWDYDSDWASDWKWKKWELVINKEWRVKITVNYKFKNIKKDDDIVDVKEIIYIEAVKKEFDVNFKINQNSEYAPALIWFDATKSTVRDSNISKFLWDFGDWIKEDWDAVVEWHRYLKDGEYNVSLTVVTSDWKKYSTSKKLVLKPKAQKVKLKSSMLSAPVGQWIDFDSSDSIWDIVSYLWDFWDWEISTSANPTHSYQKPWKYKVKLTVDFRNRNIMEDYLEVEITEK